MIAKCKYIYLCLFICMLCILGGLIWASCSYADTVILRNGREIEGILVQETNEAIVFLADGKGLTIEKSDIKEYIASEDGQEVRVDARGVRDVDGRLLPESLVETQMGEAAARSLDTEARDIYTQRYYELAQEYELRANRAADNKFIRDAYLIRALNLYEIASLSSQRIIKKSSLYGRERIIAELLVPAAGELALPLGENMKEHLNYLINELKEPRKEEVISVYMKVARQYESLSHQAGDDKPLMQGIARNCYWLVYVNTEDLALKKQANEKYQNLR